MRHVGTHTHTDVHVGGGVDELYSCSQTHTNKHTNTYRRIYNGGTHTHIHTDEYRDGDVDRVIRLLSHIHKHVYIDGGVDRVI